MILLELQLAGFTRTWEVGDAPRQSFWHNYNTFLPFLPNSTCLSLCELTLKFFWHLTKTGNSAVWHTCKVVWRMRCGLEKGQRLRHTHHQGRPCKSTTPTIRSHIFDVQTGKPSSVCLTK